LRRPTHGWGWCLLDSASSQRRTGQHARHCLAGRRGLDTEQVAAGMSSIGTQAVPQRLGRALDTRPTIEVDSGQLCPVLLTKPLTLPAIWQYGGLGAGHTGLGAGTGGAAVRSAAPEGAEGVWGRDGDGG
jgi:hypothetical protein